MDAKGKVGSALEGAGRVILACFRKMTPTFTKRPMPSKLFMRIRDALVYAWFGAAFTGTVGMMFGVGWLVLVSVVAALLFVILVLALASFFHEVD